jgi:hypothetical protein
LKIRSLSTVCVSSVWFFDAAVMILYDTSMVDQFVFIDLIMVSKVYIFVVFQALFFDSRGCTLVFLWHFPVIARGRVLSSPCLYF